MFKLVQNHKGLYFISLILIVSYSGVDLLKSILMSYIFDDHLLDSISSLIVIVLIFLGVYLIVSTLQQYVVEVLKNKIRYSLNQNLYQSYASRNIESFQKKDSSEILNEFNNEVNVVIDNYVSSKLNVFSLTISLSSNSSIWLGRCQKAFIYRCWPRNYYSLEDFCNTFATICRKIIFINNKFNIWICHKITI